MHFVLAISWNTSAFQTEWFPSGITGNTFAFQTEWFPWRMARQHGDLIISTDFEKLLAFPYVCIIGISFSYVCFDGTATA